MPRYYSRLRTVEERKRTRKAVLRLVTAVGVVIASIIFGLKYLSHFFIFISSLNPKNQVVIKEDYIPPSPPRIFLPFEATNSATISLSGTAEPGSTVFVTQNKISLGEVMVDDKGKFVMNKIQLEEGDNEFSAVVLDNAGNKSQISDLEVISYLHDQPKLEIISPLNGQKFTGKDNYIEVKGDTDPGVRLTVNDRMVILGSNGSFSYRWGLTNGENQLVIMVTDKAGNQQRKEITVNYSTF